MRSVVYGFDVWPKWNKYNQCETQLVRQITKDIKNFGDKGGDKEKKTRRIEKYITEEEEEMLKQLTEEKRGKLFQPEVEFAMKDGRCKTEQQ
jgi:hypothetical protein